MMKIKALLFASSLSLAPVFSAQSQTDRGFAQATRAQELVDQLKEVIRGAEQNRSSLSITKQLKELVHRYDWPWRVSLLHDDFSDGDFTYDPRWIVKHGEFRVARGAGLRSYFDPPVIYRASDRRSNSRALEFVSETLLSGNEPGVRATQSNAISESEIYTRVGITKSFAIKLRLRLRSYGDGNTRFEFGPFLEENRSSGYRLAYESGGSPSLSLLRFGPDRSVIIEIVERGIVLNDGVAHIVEWHRSDDGEMVVLLDNKEVIRTVDRAYDDAFDGFSMINKGGEFEISQVSILGTR